MFARKFGLNLGYLNEEASCWSWEKSAEEKQGHALALCGVNQEPINWRALLCTGGDCLGLQTSQASRAQRVFPAFPCKRRRLAAAELIELRDGVSGPGPFARTLKDLHWFGGPG